MEIAFTGIVVGLIIGVLIGYECDNSAGFVDGYEVGQKAGKHI